MEQVGCPSPQDPLTSSTRCHRQGTAVVLEAGQCNGTGSDCVPPMLCRRRPCLAGAGRFFLPEGVHFSLHNKHAAQTLLV